jgi:hypothetical protein
MIDNDNANSNAYDDNDVHHLEGDGAVARRA